LFDCLMQVLGAAPGRRTVSPGPLAAPVRALAGRLVLLVEDNELNQDVALGLLQDAGLQVELASDGAQALERLRAGPLPDAVLMDMQMPVMDGLEATRRLRELPSCANLPVIAMTANAMARDREACLAAGMNDHVGKPIDPDQLLATLGRWLGARAPAPSDSTRGLLQVEGFDLDGMRERVRGDDRRVRDLLQRFGTGQRDAMKRLRELQSQGDLAAAERVVHTLRGLSATVGADELVAPLEHMEQGLHRCETVAEVEIAKLEQRLHQLCQNLDLALDEGPEAKVAPADRELALTGLRDLAQLMADDDADAQLVWSEHAAQWRSVLGPEAAAAIEQPLRAYDFDLALQALEAWAKGQGVELAP